MLHFQSVLAPEMQIFPILVSLLQCAMCILNSGEESSEIYYSIEEEPFEAFYLPSGEKVYPSMQVRESDLLMFKELNLDMLHQMLTTEFSPAQDLEKCSWLDIFDVCARITSKVSFPEALRVLSGKEKVDSMERSQFFDFYRLFGFLKGDETIDHFESMLRIEREWIKEFGFSISNSELESLAKCFKVARKVIEITHSSLCIDLSRGERMNLEPWFEPIMEQIILFFSSSKLEVISVSHFAPSLSIRTGFFKLIQANSSNLLSLKIVNSFTSWVKQTEEDCIYFCRLREVQVDFYARCILRFFIFELHSEYTRLDLPFPLMKTSPQRFRSMHILDPNNDSMLEFLATNRKLEHLKINSYYNFYPQEELFKSTLKALSSLKSLEFNPVGSLDGYFGTESMIEKLSIVWMGNSFDWAPLKDLSRLTTLSLSHLIEISDSFLEFIFSSNLHTLSLPGTFSNEAFSLKMNPFLMKMKNLKTLSLERNSYDHKEACELSDNFKALYMQGIVYRWNGIPILESFPHGKTLNIFTLGT